MPSPSRLTDEQIAATIAAMRMRPEDREALRRQVAAHDPSARFVVFAAWQRLLG